MTQLQPVLGFFDTIAEAQQAIQLLLARGFTDEQVSLSTPTRPITTSAGKSQSPSTESGSSGRFFSSLFDNQTEVQSRHGILVTVQTQSADEASQVADLLARAGAADANKRTDSMPL